MRWNLKPFSIFYGWWVVAACFVSSLLLGGFVVLGFTAFFEPIGNEFGWSYTQVSLAASLRGVETGLFAPIMGVVVDRFGPRKLVFGGILLIGFGLIFLGRINSLFMFYAMCIVLATGASGCSVTVVMTAMTKWFHKRLGIAIGIMSSGFAFGGLLVPLIVKLIDVFDWRMTLLILGLTVWGIGLPASLLLRHRPEQYGYLPDGEPSIVTDPGQAPPAETPEVVIGTKQILKSRAFWHIGVAMMLQFTVISTVVVHVMPFLSSVNIPRSRASLVAMAVPLISIVGRIGSGWLYDKFNKKRVATGFFALITAGMLCMSYITSEVTWLIIPFVTLFGIGWGSNVTTRAVLQTESFGKSRFGTTFGLIMGLSSLGVILGPLFAGWAFDVWGSYRIVWLTFAALVFIAAVTIATTPSVAAGVRPSDK